MSPIESRIVRCKVNTASQFAASRLVDHHTKAPIETVKGSATRFQLAVFTGGNAVDDLSEFASLNLKILTSQAEGATTLADKTLAGNEMDHSTTLITWENGTRQHAEFFFSNAEMNLPVEGARQTYWVVLSAITHAGNKVSLAGGALLFHADESGAAPPPPEYPGTSITLEQAQAQFQGKIQSTDDIPGLDALLEHKADVAAVDTAVQARATSANLSPAFGALLSRIRRSAGAQASVLFIGDSMAHRIPDHLYYTLADRFPIAGYALAEVFNKVVAGTVQIPGENGTPSFEPTLWDTGQVYQMSAGGQIELGRVFSGNQLKLFRFSRAIIWCVKRPGGGTLTVEYQRDGTTWVSLGTIDTNGTLGEMARGEFNQTLYWSKLRITASGGPIYYIGAKLWRDSLTGNGLILARTSTGGLRIDQSLLAPAGIRNVIGADLGPGIIFPFYAEGAGEIDQTKLNTWISNWRTAMPTSDQIFVEQTGGPDNAGDLSHIRTLYEHAKTIYPFVNSIRTYDWLRSYTYTQTQDWNKSSQSGNPDAVHMRDETWLAMAGMIYEKAFAGYEPDSTFGLTQRTGNSYEWTLGDEAPPNHHVYYNFPVDNAANSTLGLQTRNGFGNVGGVFLNYFGTTHASLPQGAQLVLRTTTGFLSPVTIDSSGRVRLGEYNATAITATANTAGFFVQERSASFTVAKFQHLNASGLSITQWVNSTNTVVADMRADGTLQAKSLRLPGPYANDAAAGSAGVAVGDLYRVTGGSVAWRQV